ncbi:hypothetical protein PX52LOC_03398 [Limnoglobus roseus]|uniref:Uncharacterized protein n=1 Tax=Limnoglobus roseus TaxID=2598579 RepID=A0A5C1AH56_9BACT|nr:hypothetical protein PX52LOC_03398 [Limnoglobus roseus]
MLSTRELRPAASPPPIAYLEYAIGGGEAEVYRLFGGTRFNGRVSGTSLDRASRRYMDGEQVLQELVFFATFLDELPYRARSVYVHLS